MAEVMGLAVARACNAQLYINVDSHRSLSWGCNIYSILSWGCNMYSILSWGCNMYSILSWGCNMYSILLYVLVKMN